MGRNTKKQKVESGGFPVWADGKILANFARLEDAEEYASFYMKNHVEAVMTWWNGKVIRRSYYLKSADPCFHR